MSSITEFSTNGSARSTRRFRSGLGRLLALGVILALVAIVSVAVWRLRSREEIPDVGDPFDVAVARQRIEVPDDANAFVAYHEAHQKLVALKAAMLKVDFLALSWSEAAAPVREFLEQNRAALELWRAGSERPDALYHQPGLMAIDTLLPLVQDLVTFRRLALLEGSRLEEKGKLDQAWTWYRALLRSSRLVGRHGVILERLVGATLHEWAAKRIFRWAADPRVDAKLLRRALDDVLAADALTPSLSDALKLEYLINLRDLEEMRVLVTEIPMPGGRGGLLDHWATSAGVRTQFQRFRLRATNDVDRSRRALRLLYANWLAQVDKPASERANLATDQPIPIYASDPTAPAACRAVAPEILAKAIDGTVLVRVIFRPDEFGLGSSFRSSLSWEGNGPLAREPLCRANLIVKAAAELYHREHGAPPAKAGALLGSYLKVLPDGIHSDDTIPSAAD